MLRAVALIAQYLAKLRRRVLHQMTQRMWRIRQRNQDSYGAIYGEGFADPEALESFFTNVPHAGMPRNLKRYKLSFNPGPFQFAVEAFKRGNTIHDDVIGPGPFG